MLMIPGSADLDHLTGWAKAILRGKEAEKVQTEVSFSLM